MISPKLPTKFIFSLIIFISFSITNAQQLAFPTAYGAGAYTTGGRGGKVVHVTSLLDVLDKSDPNYEGTLRWAIKGDENKGVKRTIVFDVSGIIDLVDDMYVSNGPGDEGGYADGITIAGQSAPKGGITITGGKIRMGSINHVIVRYLKFRSTGNYDGCFSIGFADNLILDHLSGSHTPDIVFSVVANRDNYATDHTVQNCLMANSKNGLIIGNSSFANGYDEVPYGSVSVLRNAYYNVGWRVPAKFGGAGKFDVFNNVAHNWKSRLMRFDPYSYNINHIGNYYQSGFITRTRDYPNMHKSWLGFYDMAPKIYNEDNFVSEDIKPDGYDQNEKVSWTEFHSEDSSFEDEWFVTSPLPIQGRALSILPSSQIKDNVLESVGASKYLKDDSTVGFHRDTYDLYAINGIAIQDEKGSREQTIPQPVISLSNTRPDNFYVNNPHIPEVWFSANVPEGEDHNDIAPSGYTWLEEYLNQVDGPVTPTVAVNAESVEITPDTATLNVPETIVLSKTFTPADTTDESGVWTSSDTDIATVDSIGKVTSVSEGVVEITFTANDGGFTDSTEITVTNIVTALESVSLNPSDLTLDLSETAQLSVDFVPSNASDKTGVWTSNDDSIVTVDNDGNITGINEGTTEVIFTANDGNLTASSNITVEDTFYGTYELYNAVSDELIQYIENDTTIELDIEDNGINFISIPEGGYDNNDVESIKVDWTGPTSGTKTENDPIYAALPGGHVGLDLDPYIIENGTYNFTITYYSENNAQEDIVARDNFSLTFVLGTRPVEAVEISLPENFEELYVNSTIQLDVIFTPSNASNQNGTWSSSDTSIAEVDENGVVTGKYPGDVTITFTSEEGGFSDTVDITVFTEALQASADQNICQGESASLSASGGSNYLWSTGETTSAIEITPDATTTYTVTVSNDFGDEETFEIIVTVDEIPELTITNDMTIVLGESTTIAVEGADTYLWDDGSTAASFSVNPTETKTYNVIGTSNNCSVEAQVTVTVFSAISGIDERVCQNDDYEVVLTANDGDTYLWNTGETTQAINVSPTYTTEYSVTVTLGDLEDTGNVTVHVDPRPNVEIANGDNIDILNGDFITLSASGAIAYEWSNGATQPNIAVSPSQTTTYEVKGYINDCFEEKAVTVNVFEPVIANAGEDVTICLEEMAVLTASGGDEYLWNTGETTQSIEVVPTETTEYTVTVFNAIHFDEASVMVEVDSNCGSETDPLPVEGADLKLDMHPNPANDYVILNLSGIDESARIQVYNFSGKLLIDEIIENTDLNTSMTKQLDLTELQNGMYFIKIINQNDEITKKLIVRGY